MKKRPRLRPPFAVAASALLGAAATALGALGCGGLARSMGPGAIAIMPGVVNRPDNKSLRFALLKYGLEEFCRQMVDRGTPLKLDDSQPAVGRFFPKQCNARVVDEDAAKSFQVQFSGFGYAFTNLTKRLAFEASGMVTYAPDFLLDGSTMYLYFRTQQITSSSFRTSMVEGAGANLALLLAPGGFADKFGNELVSSQLARGFTVVRDTEGQVDFGLGMIDQGKRPFHPYQVHGDSRVVLANERVEVHAGQREFLGPFEVESDNRALYVTMSVDGVPALDLFLMPRDAADPWLADYVRVAQTTPPSYPPLMQEVVPQGNAWRRTLPVSQGRYYLVLDNTATAGRVAPPGLGFDDRAAFVDYAVELGDAP